MEPKKKNFQGYHKSIAIRNYGQIGQIVAVYRGKITRVCHHTHILFLTVLEHVLVLFSNSGGSLSA